MNPREVESIIAAHPDVLQCAVITITADQSDASTLIAHYVLRPAARLSAAELHEYIVQLLPVQQVRIELRRHAVFPPTRNGTVELDLMS